MPKPITSEALSELPGIAHGFFTREGGVSAGLYAGLNCGAGSSDDRAAVRENRRRVAEHLGANHGDVATPHQIHGADVIIIRAPLPRGERTKADAIVTRTPGLAVGILTADCAPVLFADADAGIVAAAHAGWRGAVGGVLKTTWETMISLGADPRRIVAAIGPCISLTNYEVGETFKTDLLARDSSAAPFFRIPAGKTKPHFDLPGYVAGQLRALGSTSEAPSPPCTYADESRFFSFRRGTHREEPDYGRQISAIVVA